MNGSTMTDALAEAIAREPHVLSPAQAERVKAWLAKERDREILEAFVARFGRIEVRFAP